MLNINELTKYARETPGLSNLCTSFVCYGGITVLSSYCANIAAEFYAHEQRVRADEREACARVCDELAKRNFPWASENSDRYHAQADWAEKCAAAIRARKEKE